MKQKKIVTHVVLNPQAGKGGPAGYAYHLREAFRLYPSDKYNVNFVDIRFKNKENRFVRRVKNRLETMLNGKSPEPAYVKTIRQTISSARNFSFKAADIPQSDILIVHYSYACTPVFETINRQSTQLGIMSHSPGPTTLEIAFSQPEVHQLETALRIESVRKNLDLEYEAFKQADFTLSPCYDSLDSYREVGSKWAELISSTRVINAMSGVMPPKIVRGRSEWRNELGILDKTKVGIFIGRFHYNKGYDLFVSAVEKISKSVPKNELTFIVAGGEQEFVQNGNLIRLGYVKDVGGLINSADFMINSNRHSYLDLICLESLSLDKPMVLTRAGGNKRLGELVPQLEMTDISSDGLVQGILSLSARTAMNNKGTYANAFESYFSLEKFAHNHIFAYDEILTSRSSVVNRK